MDERFDQLEEKLDELSDKLEEFSDKLEELSDKFDDISRDIEDSVECAISDMTSDVECAAENAVESAVSDLNVGQTPLITIFSQDKKFILPVYSVEARRLKKGEEPYAIYAQYTSSGHMRVIGRYANKEAALVEMQKIFKAVFGGPKFYEVK